jgi:hypothetical protein
MTAAVVPLLVVAIIGGLLFVIGGGIYAWQQRTGVDPFDQRPDYDWTSSESTTTTTLFDWAAPDRDEATTAGDVGYVDAAVDDYREGRS